MTVVVCASTAAVRSRTPNAASSRVSFMLLFSWRAHDSLSQMFADRQRRRRCRAGRAEHMKRAGTLNDLEILDDLSSTRHRLRPHAGLTAHDILPAQIGNEPLKSVK